MECGWRKNVVLVGRKWAKALNATIRPTNVDKLIGWIVWKVERKPVIVGGGIATVCRHVSNFTRICFPPSTRADGVAMRVGIP